MPSIKYWWIHYKKKFLFNFEKWHRYKCSLHTISAWIYSLRNNDLDRFLCIKWVPRAFRGCFQISLLEIKMLQDMKCLILSTYGIKCSSSASKTARELIAKKVIQIDALPRILDFQKMWIKSFFLSVTEITTSRYKCPCSFTSSKIYKYLESECN